MIVVKDTRPREVVAREPEAIMTAMTEGYAGVEELLANPAAEMEHQFRYLDRNRKVSVGPSVSFVFENARTLSFRMREVETLRRVHAPAQIEKMRRWYESLLPSTDRLTAEVSVRRPGCRPNARMSGLADSIARGQIKLLIGDLVVPGEVLPTRAGDRVLGQTFWVAFHFDDISRSALQEFAVPAVIAVESDEYDTVSEPLSYEVRSSLCADVIR